MDLFSEFLCFRDGFHLLNELFGLRCAQLISVCQDPRHLVGELEAVEGLQEGRARAHHPVIAEQQTGRYCSKVGSEARRIRRFGERIERQRAQKDVTFGNQSRIKLHVVL